MRREGRSTIRLRFIVTDPVPGVALALQSGRFDLGAPTSVTASAVTFECAVEACQPVAGGPVVCYGPVTQGPPAARFVYITVGTRAGQPNSPYERRAKIPLTGITPELFLGAVKDP